MSGAILPREGAGQTTPCGRVDLGTLRAAGHAYVANGWAVFLERAGSDGIRRPLALCPACRVAGPEHDRERCECLTCHGFYAATRDHERWNALCDAVPDATHICVRTGRASGIFVIDLDVRERGPQVWHELAAARGWPEAAVGRTLAQRTRSGGFHLVLALPGSGDVGGSGSGDSGDWDTPGNSGAPGSPTAVIRSHNRVAPGVDVKGEGGLVVVAPSPGYAWLPGPREPAVPSPELARWAASARGTAFPARRGVDRPAGAPGGVAGGSTRLGDAGPVPVGARDEFVNARCFALRRSGVAWDEALELLRRDWRRLAQPPGDEFRWEWAEYKLRRVWQTVESEPRSASGRRWLAAATGGGGGGGEPPGDGLRRVGNVVIGRRPSGGAR